MLAGGFADRERVCKITQSSVSDISNLNSFHEEAETGMLLHAIDCSTNNHSCLVIRSDDTDVLVLLLYYYSLGMLANKTYMQAGHEGVSTNKRRLIPIHDIVVKLPQTTVRCLPAMHALTGCDTTSSLCRIGKKSAFSCLLKHTEKVKALVQMGSSISVSAEVENSARQFLLYLYGNKRMKLEATAKHWMISVS